MGRRGHGEGTIARRDDGRWTAAMTLESGKRKWFYGKTRKEVQEKLTAALRDQQQGRLVIGSNQTVEQYLNRWLEGTVKTSVRASTYDCYVLCVKRALPHLRTLRLGTIKPVHIQDCYGALLKKGLSRRTVELVHSVLHRAFRQAVQGDMMGRNPTDAVSVPRPKRQEMQTLNADQVKHLLATSTNDRLTALWMLLASTGLRIGEATGLCWNDIDLDSGRIVIQRALQRQNGVGLVFVEPKTERSRRTVHLSAGAVSALREHRKRQAVERLQAGPLWDGQGLVFCTLTGKPIGPSDVDKAFHRALDQAGLPKIRVHDLRHTAATLLLSQGVHPKVVQEMLGHSTITLTLDTYSHVIPMLHQQAAELMDDILRDEADKNNTKAV